MIVYTTQAGRLVVQIVAVGGWIRSLDGLDVFVVFTRRYTDRYRYMSVARELTINRKNYIYRNSARVR